MPIYEGGGKFEIGIQTRDFRNYDHKLYYSYQYVNGEARGQIAYKGEIGFRNNYAAIFGVGLGLEKENKIFALVLGLRINLSQN